MKKAIFLLLLFTSLQSFSQTVKVKIHIIRNEIGEMGITIADAETLITKIQEDFDGTTGANMTGDPASFYDTGIRFCPEIVIHEDDELLYEENGLLATTLSAPQYVNVFLNFYGDHASSGMIAGRNLPVNNSVWVTNYNFHDHTTSHEIGHSFGLSHCTTYANNTLVDPTCFSHFMANTTSPWTPPASATYTAPYEFDASEISTMQTYLSNHQNLVITGACEEFPTADFIVDNKGPRLNQTINFTSLSSTNTVSWLWDFGDGNTSTLQNPQHQYTASGFYTVTLTATSVDNNTSNLIRTNYIHVEPTTLSIPYSEDFNDPDFYVGTTWFVEDAERNCATMMSGSNTYMWNHSSAVGDYYIHADERINFVDRTGSQSGALSLLAATFTSGYGTDIFVNSPDFDFSTADDCTSLSFSLCHIPFNNGYTLMSSPTSNDCECPGNYLSAPEYNGNTFPTPIGNWDDVCSTNNPACPGVYIGEPDCDALETLELQFSANGGPWTTVYSQTRDELLTVPGESCTQHPFAPIAADWWRRECVVLPDTLQGKTRVRFRFAYQAGEGTNTLLIDDLNINASLDLQTSSSPSCFQTNGVAMVETCSGVAPYTYQWFSGCPGVSSLSNTSNTLSVSTPGDYTVIVTDDNGCSAEACIFVDQSSVVCTPSNPTICAFECVTIGCPSNPNASYQWSHDETRSITVNGTVYNYTTTIDDGTTSEICVSPVATTTYTLDIVDNATGCTISIPVVVTVDNSASCTPAAANNNCCAPNPPIFANPCVSFEYTYGTQQEELVGSSNPLHSGTVIQTADRGFLMAGYSKDVTVGLYADQQLVKVAEDGTLEWVKAVGDIGGFSDLNDVIQTNDGAYVFTGGLGLAGSTFTMHVMKTHANGNLMWDRVLYGDYFSTSRSIIETANGDLVVGGYSNYGGETFYVVRLDANGTVIWRSSYKSTRNSYFSKVIELSNGNLALVGSTLDGGIDGYILVVDANGTKVWSANYDLGGAEEFFDVVEKGDSLFLAGYSTGLGAGDEDGMVASINKNNGSVNWTRTYQLGTYDDHFSSIAKTHDNRLVVTGQREGYFSFFGIYSYTVAVLKIQNNGNLQWARTYGNTIYDDKKGRDIIETDIDHGLAIFGTNLKDFYLIKTDSVGGSSTCPTSVIQNPTIFTTPLTATLLTSHTDQLSSPIPNFVMYTNQGIMQNNLNYTAIKTCFDTCTTISNRNGRGRAGDVDEKQISDLEQLNGFQIYPNPNAGYFTVSWEDVGEPLQSLEVFNALGEKIYKHPTIDDTLLEVNLSSYPKGVYLLYLKFASGYKMQKFLIQ